MSNGWEIVKDFATNILYFLRNPCKDGPIVAFALFLLIPIFLIYIISFPFFVLFPLGIILLLRIIKTEPALQELSQSRGLLAARIVVSIQKFRYQLMSTTREFVGNRLQGIFGSYQGLFKFVTVFLFGWFILLPSLFLLLLLFVLLLIPFFTFLFLLSFTFTAVFGITTTTTILPGASHVPPFYAPTTKSDRWSRMVIFALFGVIFGGLHCMGWNFSFPTFLEQILWRATSLAITVIPLIVAPIDFLLANIKSSGKFERMVLLTVDLIMTILLFTYVIARLSLLAQAPALLRHLPQTALIAVDWTNYVPHIFS